MLEHWFSSRSSAANIQHGTRSIANARLFSEDITFSEDCVYVGRTVDFFPTSNSQEVMMIHRNDIISVTSSDLNAVFNEVLSIFDFYGEIEQQFFSSVFKAAPEQAVLSACEQFMGPMFILSPDYRILACSQNFSGQYVNQFWDAFTIAKEPTLDMVITMKNSTVITLMSTKPHMVLFTEPNAAPYSYGLANTYFSASGTVLGYFIVANNRPITRYEWDMAHIMLDALNLIQASTIRPAELNPRHTSDDALLSRLLSGTDLIRTEQYLSVLHNLNVQNLYYMIVAQPQDTQAHSLIQKTFREKFRHCITTKSDGRSVFLFWTTSPLNIQDVMSRIQTYFGNFGIRWSVSNPFRHLQNAGVFYEQAVYALSQAEAELCSFHRHAVSYLLKTAASPDQLLARHPLILELERRPEQSRRELMDTLREYLLCERSVKKAAELLFVHRNTVTYRIDQLKELRMLDFEDPYDRQYALLSLFVDAQ